MKRNHQGQQGIHAGEIAPDEDRTSRRRRIGALLAATVVAATCWVVPNTPEIVHAASAKITICHRTHSTTNPYRRITVSQNSVQNGKHGGHGLPVNSTNPPVYDETFVYEPSNKYWGDIIPGSDAEGLPYNGSDQIDLNWYTPVLGKATFFSARCGAMTPSAFYDAEIAAGQAEADILEDLNEQAANEDKALLAALGGTFTAGNMSTWSTAVSVTTNAATAVGATEATLHGSLTVGSTSTATAFQYGTSPTLESSTTLDAQPGSVTNTTAVSAAVSGLSPSTQYYYRVLGTTNAGTDTEGILTGTIMSFVTSAATPVDRSLAIDTNSYDAAGYSLDATGPTITATPSAGDGTITFSTTTPSVCTVDSSSGFVTFASAGTCTIGATITANGIYNSATATSINFPVALATRTLTIDTNSYDAAGYTLDATGPTITATPSAGNGTITFSTTTPSVCTVDSSSGFVTFASAGTCTIGATITANGIYNSATATSISFPVSEPPSSTVDTTVPPPTTVPPTTTEPELEPDPGPDPELDPDPSPATPTTVAPASDANVRGVVWFDRNRDGQFNGNEWVLPGVSVTLSNEGATERTSGLRTAAASAKVSQTAITGADGSYQFVGLAPGMYTVTANAAINGFDYTSDTDGALDWVVGVEAIADTTSVADFAGLGRGEVVGQVFDSATLQGMPSATVSCHWRGFDDVAGSPDDVVFQVTADASGRFDMAGVPYGYFTCDGVDSATGRSSAATVASVFTAEPVEAPLPITPVDLPPMVTSPQGGLPNTGSDPLSAIRYGLLLLLSGIGLIVVVRRRSRRAL